MSEKIELGVNECGVKETVHDEGSRLIIARKQNVGPILDQNLRLRGQYNPRAHGRISAQIPVTLYYQWRREWQQKYSDKFTWNTYRTIKLNDRNFRKLRCDDGRRM